jgi:hypothetical protein
VAESVWVLFDMAEIQVIQISSVSKFVSTVSRLRDEWTEDVRAEPWFRGQMDAKWQLTPGFYRLEGGNEDELRGEFERRGLQLIQERLPGNHWEWYFLMQHYGAPTRLLDWTDGALTALYFAVMRNKGDRSAAVWMLDPKWLNRQTIDLDSVVLSVWGHAEKHLYPPYEKPVKETLPIAIDPPHVARRVAVQHSRFTIHGTIPNGLEVVAKRAKKARLVKFLIRKSAIEWIRADLATCGFVETTVFPDLEGLCRELTMDYGGDPVSDR